MKNLFARKVYTDLPGTLLALFCKGMRFLKAHDDKASCFKELETVLRSFPGTLQEKDVDRGREL